jgi:hypothetical protein
MHDRSEHAGVWERPGDVVGEVRPGTTPRRCSEQQSVPISSPTAESATRPIGAGRRPRCGAVGSSPASPPIQPPGDRLGQRSSRSDERSYTVCSDSGARPSQAARFRRLQRPQPRLSDVEGTDRWRTAWAEPSTSLSGLRACVAVRRSAPRPNDGRTMTGSSPDAESNRRGPHPPTQAEH